MRSDMILSTFRNL